MSKFICNRCFKDFPRDIDLERHNNRKYKCIKIVGYNCDNCRDSFIKKDEFNKHQKICGGLKEKVEKMSLKMQEYEKLFQTITDIKKVNDDLLVIVKKLKSKVKKHKKKIKILQENSKGDNNSKEVKIDADITGDKNKVTNMKAKTIILVNYGKESRGHFTLEDKLEILGAGSDCIPKMLQKTHCDERALQNKNIRRNKKGEFEILKNGVWSKPKNKRFLKDLIFDTDDKIVDFEDKTIKEKLSKKELKKFNKHAKNMSKARDRNSDSEDSYVEKVGKKVKKVI